MTRALIRINKGNEFSYFYLNHDGYPEGFGTTLLGYLHERFGKKEWNYKKILSDIANDKINGFSLSPSKEDFSFIYYLYVIDCEEREVRCYNCSERKSLSDICQQKNRGRIPVPEYRCAGCPPKFINEKSFIEELMEAVCPSQLDLEQYVQFHKEDIIEENISYEELKDYAIDLAEAVSRVRELIEQERNKEVYKD